MDSETDVLIVGAGPTGLVLAAELARRGVRPRVLDAGRPDVRESRAVAVVARSLEVLDDLGIAEAAVERGIPLRALSFYQGGDLLAEMDVTAVDSPFPMDLCLPQWETTGLLRQRVAELGVEIEWEARLTAHHPTGDGVVAEITHADGRRERCHAGRLVGCDGTHSTVRGSAGIGWDTADLRRGFILGDLSADWRIPRDRFHVHFARTGLVAVFPMPGGYWRVLANTPDDHPPRDPGPADFAAYLADRTPLDPHVRDLRWSSAFVAREGLARTFASGRVLLAGDAAHSHSPIGGQGMNTGMQDAYNLGWKLALVTTGRAAESLVDSYGTERRPVAEAVVGATSTATRIATHHALVARRARRHALRLLSRLDAVQQRFADAIGEHLVNYRDSALVSEHWPSGDAGPGAGEVVRDACVETGAGLVALRHVLRGTGHHLVVFAAGTTDPETLSGWHEQGAKVMAGHGEVSVVVRGLLPPGSPEGVFADRRGEAHDRYGVRRPSLYLVRPDKYVGHRRDDVDLTSVHDYFDTLGAHR